MEVWKDIKGYEGFYQISSCGRIKSIGFIKSLFGKEYKHIKRDLILTPTDNGNGYLIVFLKKRGVRKNHYVHRLVAEHFVENPKLKKCVNHKDYNTKNNNADNLEWVTQKENIHHSAERMKHPKKICKQSNTGEKYITKRGEKYRVVVKQHNVDKTLATLDEAIKYRNEVLYGFGITI